MMESGCEELPLTLCAGVGKVVVPGPVAATEPDEPREGSEEVAGENCEGLWGVWGWKDIMNQGSLARDQSGVSRQAGRPRYRCGKGKGRIQAVGFIHSACRR